MRFPRQKYCRGLPFPSPRDLPNPEIEPTFPALTGGFFTTEPPGKPALISLSFRKKKSSWFSNTAAAAAKSLQSCLTLSDPMDYSPPGSSVHGIFPGKRTGVGCHCLLRPCTADILQKTGPDFHLTTVIIHIGQVHCRFHSHFLTNA